MGLILDIINKTEIVHMHNVWVHELIKLAQKKYNPTWIINADADEFWFSEKLNLKESLINVLDANVLKVMLNNFVPVNDSDDYLNEITFSKRPIVHKYEKEKLSLGEEHSIYTEKTYKVIHKSKGYKMISMGNHEVEMVGKKELLASDIAIYHFFVRNYKHFEKKVINGGKSLEEHPDKKVGVHWRYWWECYKEGTLKDEFNKIYSKDLIEKLIDCGCICPDPTLKNYIEEQKLLDKAVCKN